MPIRAKHERFHSHACLIMESPDDDKESISSSLKLDRVQPVPLLDQTVDQISYISFDTKDETQTSLIPIDPFQSNTKVTRPRRCALWLITCGLLCLYILSYVPEISLGCKQTIDTNARFCIRPWWKFWPAWRPRLSEPEVVLQEDSRQREIPQYVLDYAPLIYLYSGEQFWPCDIAEHLIHTTPHLNYTPLRSIEDHPTLSNLNQLNKWGRDVFLQSDDNVEKRPEWLGGESNIPSTPGDPDSDSKPTAMKHSPLHQQKWDKYEQTLKVERPSGSRVHQSGRPQYDQNTPNNGRTGSRTEGGRSDAPAVLVVVNKDDGIVDAFWFFFYSYNLGNQVFNVRFGNHVGDWEHTLVRFKDGKPQSVFFSEHSFGEAYTFEALEKIGKRPVGYSATGTHAMYGTPGTHPYVLPWGLLHDVTDRGPLWDPLLNMHSYTYDYRTDTLKSSNITPESPTEWFYYIGHWGDKDYPLTDPRQYMFAGQYHYVNGPLGPRFKNLGRKRICQGGDACLVKNWLGADGRVRRWRQRYPAEGEEMSAEDVRRLIEAGQLKE